MSIRDDAQKTVHMTGTEEMQKKAEIVAEYFPLSQLLPQNPVMQDTPECRSLYFIKLREYIARVNRENGWYETAELEAYEKLLRANRDSDQKRDFSYYQYFLLLDTVFILGGRITEKEMELLQAEHRQAGFANNRQDARVAEALLKAFAREPVWLDGLLRKPRLSNEREYIRLMRRNRQFQQKKPCTLLVTATMSAGKSSFINALAGKKLCKSRVEACTGKIHTIYNKAFEDGLSYEYDHALVLTAGAEELMDDNEENQSDSIAIAAKFDGKLKNTRLLINDSPGVNFSGCAEHRDITRRMLETGNYDILLYVMNATQLATQDEDEHLNFVKKTVGTTPVIFVLNKVDELDPEEEDLVRTLCAMREYLEEKGFPQPLICPVSARAGWMAKNMEKGSLSRRETMWLETTEDLLEELDIPGYYKKAFPRLPKSRCSSEQERLLRASGIVYIEEIIMRTGRN